MEAFELLSIWFQFGGIGASASVDAYANGTIVGEIGAGIDLGAVGFNVGTSVGWNGNSGWTESANLSAGIAGVGFDLGETQIWGTNGSYAGGIANAGVWVGILSANVGVGVQFGWGSAAMSTGGYFDASALGAQASYNVDTGQASFGATAGVVKANFYFDSQKGISFAGFSCPIWDELQTDSNWLQYATASKQSVAATQGTGDNGGLTDGGQAYYASGQQEATGVLSKSGTGIWMVPGDIEEDGSASGGWLIETVTLHVSTEGTRVSVWATDIANSYDFFDLEQSVSATLKVGTIVIAHTELSEQVASEFIVPEGQRFIGSAVLTIPDAFYGSGVTLNTSTTFTVANENGGYIAGKVKISVPIQAQQVQ